MMAGVWERIGGGEVAPAMQRDFWRRTAVFSVLYLLLVLPIIQADYLYIDDLGRAQDGLTQWGEVGRPLTSIVMDLLNFSGGPITDIAPLPQLLAALVLALASAWTSMFARLRFGLAMLPMGLLASPFLLENLSYRFDSVTMALAMAFALLPFGLVLVMRGRALHGLTAIALWLSLNLYQPGLSVFAVLTLFAALLDIEDGTIALAARRVVLRFAALVVALVVYKVEIAAIPQLGGLYMSEHSAMALTAPSIILRNIDYGYNWLFENLLPSLPASTLLAAMALGIAVFLFDLVRGNRPGGLAGLAVAAGLSGLCFAGMILGIFGVTILLRDPIWVPRVCVGFGALSACLVAVLTRERKSAMLRRCAGGLTCILLFGELTLGYAYGNALHAQRALESQIAGDIAEDAFALSGGGPAVLEINATEPVAPAVAIAKNLYPIIGILLPLPMNGGWMWGGVLLRLYGLPANIQFGGTASVDAQAAALVATCKMDGMMKNRYFSMYKSGDLLLVDFSRKCG